jgi:hypothetical protein
VGDGQDLRGGGSCYNWVCRNDKVKVRPWGMGF